MQDSSSLKAIQLSKQEDQTRNFAVNYKERQTIPRYRVDSQSRGRQMSI